MKLLVLLGFVLIHQIAASSPSDTGVVASMDSGVTQAMDAFEMFTKATYNASCGPCKCQSCCPVIVRNCAPKWVGTVVESYGEWMGNAAVIVDWGCTAYNPCGCGCAKGRLCTTKDTNFVWSVNWGDGTIDHGYQVHLGPFQQTHQYTKSCQARCYQVTVTYCHDPGCPAERCCDTYYRVIDVNGHSGKGLPFIDYNKPLAA